MKTTIAAVIAALLTLTTASAALACSLAPEGWFVEWDRIRAQPAGPYVVPLDNYYGYDSPPVVSIEATDENDEVVAGQADLVFADDGQAFLVWTPTEELDPAVQYSATLDFEQEADPGPNEIALVPVQGLQGFAANVTAVGGGESATPATKECCTSDEACFTDSCGDTNGTTDCQTCWTTSWDYVIRPRVELEITDAETGRYILELAHIADGGERTVLAESLVLSPGTFPMSGRTLDAGDDVPVCLQVTATDILTGDAEVVVDECAEEADIERADRDREIGTAPDYCEPNTFTEIDETGEERPIEGGPGKGSSDGCSAAGTGVASWLLLLVAGFARRRRRAA